MALFRHPHLVRGIVHTQHGAFVVVRGLVDVSDDIGDDLGWTRAEGSSLSRPLDHDRVPSATQLDARDAS
ncbi:MAG: hypothetical protein ABIP65_11900 [Vicinamibacterales bacterium]